MLKNANGEVTSHLQGFWLRTLKFLEFDIKPVFVFDGTPPEMKLNELRKRRDLREKAHEEQIKAEEEGNVEEALKQNKRNVKVSREIVGQCKKLVQAMGMPIVEAPCEAEATCVAMLKKGLVYSIASEDTDCLTHGSPNFIKNFTVTKKKDKKDNDP